MATARVAAANRSTIEPIPKPANGMDILLRKPVSFAGFVV
jgi:hypothetical protein